MKAATGRGGHHDAYDNDLATFGPCLAHCLQRRPERNAAEYRSGRDVRSGPRSRPGSLWARFLLSLSCLFYVSPMPFSLSRASLGARVHPQAVRRRLGHPVAGRRLRLLVPARCRRTAAHRHRCRRHRWPLAVRASALHTAPPPTAAVGRNHRPNHSSSHYAGAASGS